MVWACSLGQALIFTGEAIAVILGGNLASAFKIQNISWRAAPLGLAVTAFLVAVAIAVFIREPKKGRFIVQVGRNAMLHLQQASESGCDSIGGKHAQAVLISMPQKSNVAEQAGCVHTCLLVTDYSVCHCIVCSVEGCTSNSTANQAL